MNIYVIIFMLTYVTMAIRSTSKINVSIIMQNRFIIFSGVTLNPELRS